MTNVLDRQSTLSVALLLLHAVCVPCPICCLLADGITVGLDGRGRNNHVINATTTTTTTKKNSTEETGQEEETGWKAHGQTSRQQHLK